MAYVTVYSPDGKKFEVASRDRADKLILQEGWTQTPPVVAEEAPKKTTRRKKKEEPHAEEDVVDTEMPKAFDGWNKFDSEEPTDNEL